MKQTQFRDVTIIEINQKQVLVVSCDSCGGIGLKEHDVLQLSPYYVGRYTSRVVLMELICVGASPVLIANGVANEMDPTASEILRGITDELFSSDLKEVALTGSSEENMLTFCTGVGITGVGIALKSNLIQSKIEPGNLGVLIGIPKVGEEVVLGEDDEIIRYSDIKTIISLKLAKQIVPIGSKGISYEARLLGDFHPYDNTSIDLQKSGGPSTSVFAVMDQRQYEKLKILISAPCVIIGDYH